MSVPENTTDRDPELHLLGLMGGSSRYITDMEAAGQQQLVHSDTLPTKGPWQELAELGFVSDEVVPADPLFRRCTLPDGWKREGSDHAMWSYVVDERGIRRVAVFYKAAFYDRSAHCSIENVGRSFASKAVYGDSAPDLPACWDQLTGEERAEFTETLDEYLVQAAEHPSIYGDRAARARSILRLVRP